MQSTPIVLFRRLLTELPRGASLSTQWLSERGLSAQQIARIAKAGWLRRLGRGVYLLQGDVLEREATLAWLAHEVPGLHVAGKTALAWCGIRHKMPYIEKIVLWGDDPFKPPPWLCDAFAISYHATHLFDKNLPGGVGVAPLPAGREDLLVSTPERALLELLSDVGRGQGLEETRNLVQRMRSLRLEILEHLLRHLTRIQVVRLAHSLAQEFDSPWKSLARDASERLGGGKRWATLTRTGERLNLKRPI